MQLGAMFAIWYILNIYFNIFNKQVLKVYTFPATVTAFHFGCGTLMILIMWASNLYHRPKLTRSQLAVIIPLAIVHTLGNLLTNVSIGRVNVSFTHTIKAMQPFFIVLFSVLFLGEWPTFWIVFSLIPVVGGVALASFTEASFNCIVDDSGAFVLRYFHGVPYTACVPKNSLKKICFKILVLTIHGRHRAGLRKILVRNTC
ncbi:hypothetical protein E1A91_A11G247500v1 [Gossypium mustelinum]|uniref:Sugar phosphate transporter domain-containing protein n=1 Tax=Gossypium mustelinum TaxID=34275 RepID=A0A5D2XBD8_GOSMU|nr:hypothetical protein E1A91_A11G247500v1 [Gossypium mustelinum]